MNWYTKAKIFKLFSSLPKGPAIYRFLQTHVTKSIVATPERVRQKMDLADRYLNWLLSKGYTAEKIRQMRHLDFGAGWHPTIPIYFAMQGFRGQVLVDLFPVLREDSFREAEELVRAILTGANARPTPLPLTGAPDSKGISGGLAELLQAYEMDYRAPYESWARETDFRADLVTCSQVLLHIERPILDHCFELIKGILSDEGLFMSEVHLFDIYANSDPSISRFNHLKYSKEFWDKRVNSDLMTFNRYKSRDYRDALENVGFEITGFDVTHENDSGRAAIDALDVHPEFRARYTSAELAEILLFFVARKP